jgi:hypothetical protein
MLSGALQRNAEHEARLSNISVKVREIQLRNNRRLFAPVRMTFMRQGLRNL